MVEQLNDYFAIAMTYFVGQRLRNNKYVLKQEIGKGSFGIIYLAVDRTLRRSVAIKTLDLPLRQHPNFHHFVRQFYTEAIVLAKFSHPNIIGVKDFFIENRLPYIVMDYIPGQTLDRIVLPDRPLPETTAIEYIRQIGAALQAVHNQGLVHRDIKPKNLILDRDRKQIIALDFGSARTFAPNKLELATNLVSDGYAPIEQYLPEAELTPATDIYALAATLYTLLTGKIPPSSVSRYHNLLDSPQQIRPEISDRLNDAIMYGMALEAQHRPASVAEWLALLPFESSNSSIEAIEPMSTSIVVSTATRQVTAIENLSIKSARANNLFKKTVTLTGKMMLGIGAFAVGWLPWAIARQEKFEPPNSNLQIQALPAIEKKLLQPSIDTKRLSSLQKISIPRIKPISNQATTIQSKKIVAPRKPVLFDRTSRQDNTSSSLSLPKKLKLTNKPLLFRSRYSSAYKIPAITIAKSPSQSQIVRQSSPRKFKPLFRQSERLHLRIDRLEKKQNKLFRQTQRKLAKLNRQNEGKFQHRKK
ncbi:MAG: serine/threonine protein kinase [Xenococcaceae cyanobacterium]